MFRKQSCKKRLERTYQYTQMFHSRGKCINLFVVKHFMFFRCHSVTVRLEDGRATNFYPDRTEQNLSSSEKSIR